MYSKLCDPHPKWTHREKNDYISRLEVLFTPMTNQNLFYNI